MDLFGQVNAESTGIHRISGADGQPDFVMGACLFYYKLKNGSDF